MLECMTYHIQWFTKRYVILIMILWSIQSEMKFPFVFFFMIFFYCHWDKNLCILFLENLLKITVTHMLYLIVSKSQEIFLEQFCHRPCKVMVKFDSWVHRNWWDKIISMSLWFHHMNTLHIYQVFWTISSWVSPVLGCGLLFSCFSFCHYFFWKIRFFLRFSHHTSWKDSLLRVYLFLDTT